MFISKKDLNDLKSKAGAIAHLQSEFDRLKHSLGIDKFVNTDFFGTVAITKNNPRNNYVH
jgi:hypothetical protein